MIPRVRRSGVRQRGHLLLLLMVILSAAGLSGALLASQMSQRVEARADDALRAQALWLARSALDAGATGLHRIDTPSGVALVQITAQGAGRRAVVDLGPARATVQDHPPLERFER